MKSTHWILTAAAVLCGNAWACDDAALHAADAKASANASSAASAAAPTADKLVVTRDKDTGQLRAATPAEVEALKASGGLRRSSDSLRVQAAPTLRSHSSGAKGVRLNDQFASYSVAVRQADGSLTQRCVPASEVAAALAARPASAASVSAPVSAKE